MVPGSIPGTVEIFNKEFIPGTRSHGGAEPQSLVSVPDILGLNPKSLRSAYEVKACVLLIAIHLSDECVKPGGLLGDF